MIRLLLVRHGQASFDADDYDCLSPLGVRQAACVGAWWHLHGGVVDAVWQGGLRRQQQSAQAWCAGLTNAAAAGGTASVALPAPQCHPGLAEFDHREVFLAHRPDLADPAALQAWKAAPGDYARRFADTYAVAQARWVGGQHAADYTESWTGVRQRVVQALGDIAAALQPLAAARGAAQALVFTSAGPVSAAIQQVWQLPDTHVPQVQASLHNAGITELQLPVTTAVPDTAGWMLGQIDRTVHLELAGLPLTHR